MPAQDVSVNRFTKDLLKDVEKLSMAENPMILVADDDERLTAVLKIRLGQMGYEVITADNGQRAFELAQDQVPDLLVLDVNMPGCDGFSLIEAMDQVPKLNAIPVIYISGAVEENELSNTGGRLGAVATMRKPFEFPELIENIRFILPPPVCAA